MGNFAINQYLPPPESGGDEGTNRPETNPNPPGRADAAAPTAGGDEEALFVSLSQEAAGSGVAEVGANEESTEIGLGPESGQSAAASANPAVMGDLPGSIINILI